MARIDRLAAEDKRVLQAAAVIGRSLPFLLLQAILDPADELCANGSRGFRARSSSTRRARPRSSSTRSSTR